MSAKPLRILQVDDDEDDLFFFARAVRAAAVPVEVVTALGAEQALGRLAVHTPDLILLDIRMPMMSGFELLEKLRATNHVPVVIFTTSAHEADIRQAQLLGAAAYCIKPSGTGELVDFVKRLYQKWVEGGRPSDWSMARAIT